MSELNKITENFEDLTSILKKMEMRFFLIITKILNFYFCFTKTI